MVADQVQALWESAQATWPEVNWPLEAYRLHLEDQSPTHPHDLYVAGAAGHRIQPAWSAIDEAYRVMVIRRLERSARADMEAEDLWSEAVARMMRDDPESGTNDQGEPVMHIARYRGLTKLPWHFLAAARTIAIDRHRKRERGPRQVSAEAAVEIEGSRQQDDPALQSSARELADVLSNAVVQAFENLEARHQFLLAAIYRDGLGKADAGEVVGLSPWQTSRELRKAEEQLRLQVQHLVPGEWSSETRAAWDHGWRLCWNQLAPSDPDKGTFSEGAA
ncbi:MAG: sigma-70 family RNA polymerase sigma factor [Phycisphaerales bacterium]|nr:sigma-70 family RNA polymerase sigma factor [Phycisphaerales bacterium]